MNKIAGRYAILQFMPYPETGEFANVGVVLACPTQNYFGYQLETKKYGRLTQFFEELDGKVFTRSIAAFESELERVRNVLVHTGGEMAVRQAFKALVHPRDAILRFGEERTILIERPAATLKELFGRYVEHNFVKHEYHEKLLEKRVQKLIGGLDLLNPFKEAKLGEEDFIVRFPLVQLVNDIPAKIIKPFFLGQDDATAIYNHGDYWHGKLKRLRKRNQLPERTLFAVEGPAYEDNKKLREKAFNETCENLKEFVQIVPQAQEDQIIQFAAANQ
jgi:hypothetical protein